MEDSRITAQREHDAQQAVAAVPRLRQALTEIGQHAAFLRSEEWGDTLTAQLVRGQLLDRIIELTEDGK